MTGVMCINVKLILMCGDRWFNKKEISHWNRGFFGKNYTTTFLKFELYCCLQIQSITTEYPKFPKNSTEFPYFKFPIFYPNPSDRIIRANKHKQWPDWAIYRQLGNFLKSLAILFLTLVGQIFGDFLGDFLLKAQNLHFML